MQSWLQSLSCVAAGLFLTNGIPHFVKGICGDRFPTPFAKPPGKGLSSAPLNVAWGLFNFLLGALLALPAGLLKGTWAGWCLFVAGAVLFSFWSSWSFAHKHKEA